MHNMRAPVFGHGVARLQPVLIDSTKSKISQDCFLRGGRLFFLLIAIRPNYIRSM